VKGSRFGRWVVLGWAHGKPPHYLCRCDCGTVKTVNADNLRRGKTNSCGCIQRTHGKTNTPEYSVWREMLRRCDSNRARYGGRGIAVVPEWRSFEAFFRDMGRRPSPNHSLDRVDNDGDYGPGNCRWATPRQQSRNRSNNRLFTFRGKTMVLADWARETGINKNTLWGRIHRWGWSLEEAFTLAPGKTRRDRR
jgi:hypothetical protein